MCAGQRTNNRIVQETSDASASEPTGAAANLPLPVFIILSELEYSRWSQLTHLLRAPQPLPMEHALRPGTFRRLNKQFFTMIVVSGLLTTSTFPALYAPDATPEGTGDAIVSANGLFSAFRATCGVSFAFSVVTICISLMFIMVLQSVAGVEDGLRQLKFSRVTAAQLGHLHHVTVASFYLSLGTSFAAAILTGLRFDVRAAGVTLIVFVGVAAVLVAAVMLRMWLTLTKIGTAKALKPDREFSAMLMHTRLQDLANVMQR